MKQEKKVKLTARAKGSLMTENVDIIQKKPSLPEFTPDLLRKGISKKADTKAEELKLELKRKVAEIKKMNKKKKELQKQQPKVVDGGAAGSPLKMFPKPKKSTSKKKSLTGLIEEQAKAMQGLE